MNKNSKGLTQLPDSKPLAERLKLARLAVTDNYPPSPFKAVGPAEHDRIDSLADAIVTLSEVGENGDLGLFWWTMAKTQYRLREELEKSLLASMALEAQLQKVRRCLIVLAMLRDERAIEYLVGRLPERIDLDAPGSTKPFRSFAISEMCAYYGDSVIVPVSRRFSQFGDTVVSETETEAYVALLRNACGRTAKDTDFLSVYFRRRAAVTSRNKALTQLAEALSVDGMPADN